MKMNVSHAIPDEPKNLNHLLVSGSLSIVVLNIPTKSVTPKLQLLALVVHYPSLVKRKKGRKMLLLRFLASTLASE